MEQNQSQHIANFFQKNRYVIIKNFLDPNTVGLIYRYCITKVMQMDFKTQHDKEAYNKEWDGEWGDPQAPSSYSNYGDTLMDTLLTASLPMMQQYTGLNLIPNYTYWRFYQKGEELTPHRDRHSCEISTTICLGYDNSNTDPKQNYTWPIYIEDLSGQFPNGVPVEMQPGDMVIYHGCELTHWRERLEGLAHAQLFMHYNERVSGNQKAFDGRPIIGIPKKFQSDSII